MDGMNKEQKSQIEYWVKSAKHDLLAADTLFESKRYDWCLFLGHLVLEKILKAFYVKEHQKFPPKIHRLEVLADYIKLNLTAEEIDFLKEVNEFNLEARYPDYQFRFYRLCTKSFASKYFGRIKEFHQCLLKKLK